MIILISEDAISHYRDRLNNRFAQAYLDLPEDQRRMFERRKEELLAKRNLLPNGKVAYRLVRLKPSDRSRNYDEVDGQPFYRFLDKYGNLFIGDEIWMILVDKTPMTLLLRKSSETQNRERMKGKWRVDWIFTDTKEFPGSAKPNVGVDQRRKV